MKGPRKRLLLLVVSLVVLLAATLGVFAYLVYESTFAPLPTSDVGQLAAQPMITLPPVEVESPTPPESAGFRTPVATPGQIPFRAVVRLMMLYKQQGGLTPVWIGSGTVISPDGLIVTNAHVVRPDTDQVDWSLQIAFTSEQDKSPVPRFFAEVLQADAELDIAVIRPSTDIDGNQVDRSALNLAYVSLGDSDSLRLGDPLTILGYPGIGGDTITLTRGDVGGFTHDDKYGDRAFIKTSATIAGGNSGGLAADSSGNLVGIPTRAGYGVSVSGEDLVDCRSLADTNGDGAIDQADTCIPVGGFINALRPVNLAKPLIEAARRGEVAITVKPVATEAQPRTAGLLFWDDFSDTSFSNSQWRVQGGTWEVGEGVLKFSANGSLFAGDSSWQDYAFSVDIMGIEVVDKALDFRLKDMSHRYGIDFRSDPYNDIVLVKVSPANANQVLQSVHVPNYSNTWYTLTVMVVGNRIRIMVNDRVVLDYVDNDAPILAGGVGLGGYLQASAASAIYFDNAIVVAPTE